MNKASPPTDLLQLLLSVLFISVMIIACLWILRPFFLGFAWAGTIVIASWPLLLKLQHILWGKRSLAVIVITLLLLMLFVVPIALLIESLVQNTGPLINWATKGNITLPTMEWLHAIPLVGNKLYQGWNMLLANGGTVVMDKIRPYIGATTTWFFGQAIHVGTLLMHLGLMLIFSVLLYAKGEVVGNGIRHFAFRLASKRGDAAVLLAGQAIRAVALGIVVTALVQGILGGIGLAISGIPFSALLTVVMIFCCLVQLGPLVVLVPAIIWLYWSGDTTWGTVLLIWSCVVGTMDNVIRPILIRMGADLPMILTLAGVIGGLIAFGMIGLFIGPVLLAVSYRLISVWIHEADEPSDNPEELSELIEEPESSKSSH